MTTTVVCGCGALSREECLFLRGGLDVPEPGCVGTVRIVTLDEFADAEETGADALLGTPDEALLAVGSDALIYGDGGAGKTTLCVDLACHLAAGDTWLNIAVPARLRVLLVEAEGPRPFFRAKLRRKRDGWTGSPLGSRVRVWEEPWSRFTFADDRDRQALAGKIAELEIDVVVAGPVTRIGMNEAGTMQQVRDFLTLVGDVRRRAARTVCFLLVHHENKGGKVSGAWEGSGDTLLHLQAPSNGFAKLTIQKARWASSRHATVMLLPLGRRR